MSTAVAYATRHPKASLLKLEIQARAPDGQLYKFSHRMPVLPVKSAAGYEQTDASEKVARRFSEIAAAQLYDQALIALGDGDWSRVKALLDRATVIAAEHPWLEANLAELRGFFERREEGTLAKEFHYSSRSMRTRLTQRNEAAYTDDQGEFGLPNYLRRKSVHGRGVARS